MIEVAQEAEAELVCGPSLKAALDCDWDQHGQREEALSLVLQVLQAVETWVQTLQQEGMELAQPSLEVAQQIQAQDVEFDEQGKASLINGLAFPCSSNCGSASKHYKNAPGCVSEWQWNIPWRM